MIDDYKYYLREKYDFDGATRLGIGLAIFVIGGVLGFIYEVIFYYANSGFRTVFWRGATFGPWLDSYCVASIAIFILLYSLRRQPWFVIILSAVGLSLIQLLVGMCLYFGLDKTRAWNYNLEILNYGNIGGFVCLRTLIEYAVLSVLIIYVIAPLIYRMAYSINRNAFIAIWFIIGFICIADIAYNDIICILIPSLRGAMDLYKSFGFKYMSYN